MSIATCEPAFGAFIVVMFLVTLAGIIWRSR